MARIQTGFDPKQHGYRFVNYFEFDTLSSYRLPIGKGVALGSVVYGLCGGMVYSALDYFNAKKPIPAAYNLNDVDDIPLRMFRYLWERQVESLNPPVLPMLLSWAVYADSTVSRLTATQEVSKARSLIDQRKPAPLVLLRSSGLASLTQNHQVLAVAYDYDPTSKNITLELYEPNWPGRVPTISLNLSKPSQGINLKQSTGENLRGFFVSEYQSQPPI